MIFALSKILWTLASPANVILFALIVGFAAHTAPWRRMRRFGRGVLGLTIAVSIVLAVLPIGGWLLRPLEDRFPAVIDPPARVDGIVLLGGAIDMARSADRPGVALGNYAERVTEFVGLARQYPDAKLIFTGGSGLLFDQIHREADYMGPLLATLGIDPGRLLLDRDARNTHENAVNALALAQPQPGEVWLLVTSAFHMPRSIGAFRRAGWTITAYPVDYVTGTEETFHLNLDYAGGLSQTSFAIHEWLGLLAYWWFGWTDALFPGPQAPAG
jgi:uncharacterized SAM-binding protein YcdF (DUF218 family)